MGQSHLADMARAGRCAPNDSDPFGDAPQMTLTHLAHLAHLARYGAGCGMSRSTKRNGMVLSSRPPLTWIVKCRCGPDEKPVLPESPIFWPSRTYCPTPTVMLSSFMCA